MNCYDLLREVIVSKNLGQFRDGLIRPISFPSHRLMPPPSKLSIGLTVPPQAEPSVPYGLLLLFYLADISWTVYGKSLIGIATVLDTID